MKRILIGLTIVPFIVAALVVQTQVTSAHASLTSSNPADKQVLASAPAAVTLTFSENVSPVPQSYILVTTNGNDVSSGPATVSSSDPKTLTLPLKANLPAGQYTVFWKSTSADDGGVTFGRFSFFVGQVNAADVATAVPGVAVAVPDAAKSAALTETTKKDSSDTGWIVGIVVAAVAGLIVGGVGGALIARRST